MTPKMPFALRAKARLVGTPLEEPAKRLRWLAAANIRRKHPELWEVYLEERWLPLILAKLLKPDSNGVDVGCHIGSFLSLLAKFAPRGRHIAFEASTARSAGLRRRFPNIEVLPVAVSDVAGTGVFVEDLERPGYSFLRRVEGVEDKGQFSYEVMMCRLDDVLVRKGRVDLIKVDIEGGELAAFRGGRETINKWRPTIIFECASEYDLERQNLSRQALYDFICGDLGYTIHSFADFHFGKGEMGFDEFRRCGIYPFRAFNFIACPRHAEKLA
jgi:FkbM family methyltransferase